MVYCAFSIMAAITRSDSPAVASPSDRSTDSPKVADKPAAPDAGPLRVLATGSRDGAPVAHGQLQIAVRAHEQPQARKVLLREARDCERRFDVVHRHHQ